jgi:Protein of unknown function (DUF2835)
MTELRFYLHLPRYEALRYYQGQASSIVVRAENGQIIQFPAHHIRPFVDADGVHGLFRIRFDSQHKLQLLERIR